MSDPNDLDALLAAYRARAEECRRAAESSTFKEVRDAYRDLEKHWEDLAREAEEAKSGIAQRVDSFIKKVG